MNQVLKPYVDRMNVYIAICICSIMFETYCVVMEIFITDFRNTRLARSLNMILNLTALMLQTFIFIIDFNQDFVEGIKRHTIYPVMRVLGMEVPSKESLDDQYFEVGNDGIASEQCSLSIVSNISLIYSILLGMSDFWQRTTHKFENLQELYYQSEFLKNASDDEIWT